MQFLCIDPAWSGGTPPDEVVARFDGVRFVARPDLWDAVSSYLDADKKVMLVITSQSGPVEQYADWASADWFADRVYWTIGNEPDGEGEASWIMSPDEYAELWARARCLHGQRFIAGMCSGQPDIAVQYVQPDADGLCVHLYGLSPEAAQTKISAYAKATGLPVWVGEWHEADGFSPEDYDFGEVWANYFCYSDAMHAGMGLRAVA
jgi:hypothetical protein